MEITQEKTGDLNAKILVKISPEDYRPQVKKIINDYARKANIKGFRPGKVPSSVIRKMFGKGVVYEELNKIISEKLNGYIEEEKLPLVGEPLAIPNNVELDPESKTTYEFEYEVGLAPEVAIDYGLAGTASFYKVSVDDEILEKEIESIQERHGPMTNPEESQEGDILYGKLHELDGEGNIVEEGLEKMVALNPKRVKDEDLKAEMGKGKKAEDTLDLRMEQFMENDNEIRNFWETNVQGENVRQVSEEELEEIKGKQFRFEVRKINRIEKMEIGPELFDKVFGEGAVEDEEAFKARISEDMEKFFGNESKKFYRAKTIKALVEGTEIPLPDEFLKRWLVSTREQVTEENIEELYESYARSLRWRLIVEQMQRENDSVRVDQDDIVARAKEMVKEQFGAMVPEDDEERMQQFVSYFLNDQKMVERIFDELVEDHVFAHLETQNPVAEEEITATGFMDVLKNV